MPLELTSDVALLRGHVDIAEAEDLMTWLTDGPGRPVDVADCPSAHTAILQLLLALRPQIIGAEGQNDWRALLTGPLATQLQA